MDTVIRQVYQFLLRIVRPCTLSTQFAVALGAIGFVCAAPAGLWLFGEWALRIQDEVRWLTNETLLAASGTVGAGIGGAVGWLIGHELEKVSYWTFVKGAMLYGTAIAFLLVLGAVFSRPYFTESHAFLACLAVVLSALLGGLRVGNRRLRRVPPGPKPLDDREDGESRSKRAGEGS